MKDKSILWDDFHKGIKTREKEIKKIKAKINGGKFPWSIVDGKREFKNLDEHIMWALFIRFVCGFHQPIISKEDANSLNVVGKFLKYKSFIFNETYY